MATDIKLIIDPKKWLGDNKILKMDWEVRAMHFHLMLISWQNTPPATIENDHNIICKYLGLDNNSDLWNKKVWPQLKSSWEEKDFLIDGVKQKLLVQPGLFKEIEKQIKPKKIRKTKNNTTNTISNEIINISNIYLGFNLANILEEKNIFNQKFQANQIPSSIWELGTQFLVNEDFDNKKARAFLIKLAKEYGSTQLAQVISTLGMKKITPIEARSYLVGTLKKQQNNNNKFIKHNQAGKLVL